MQLPNPSDHRRADHPIESLFLSRWSPRAMSGESLSDAELMRLFEAARWAPSSYNEQPWRIIYAKRDTPNWSKFVGFLWEANQVWASRAGALMVFSTCKVFSRNGKPNAVHVFDCGAAWENLALQGSKMGLVVHAMAGFDADKARAGCGIPDEFVIPAMVAVGRPGDPNDLPENLRGAEVPTGRKPVAEFCWEGAFRR